MAVVSGQEQQVQCHHHAAGRDSPVQSGPYNSSLVERTKQPFLLREEEFPQSGNAFDVGARAHHQQSAHH